MTDTIDTAPEADLLRAVEAFLYREARLMDERAYDDWLALWDDDATYVVPGDVDEPDPARDVHIIFAARPQIEDRVARLAHAAAYAQQPPSQLCRVVCNVEIEPGEDGDDGIVMARSKFMLTEVRRGRQRIFAGTVAHTLRRTTDGFRIRGKHVLLANRAEALGNLTFLV